MGVTFGIVVTPTLASSVMTLLFILSEHLTALCIFTETVGLLKLKDSSIVGTTSFATNNNPDTLVAPTIYWSTWKHLAKIRHRDSILTFGKIWI